MKTISSRTIGLSHISENIPCQDFTTSFNYNSRRSCIVLCDGAGSSKLSHISSEKFSNAIGGYFSKSIKRKSKNKIKRQILELISEISSEICRKNNCKNNDIYSTLLFVYFDKNSMEMVCGHIGDGVIAESRNGVFYVLSAPENGEYSNSTFFVNSTSAKNKMRMIKKNIPRNVDGYIVMSDGAEESLYNKKTKNIASAASTMRQWLHTNKLEDVQSAIDTALREQLSKKTNDDISLSIMDI